jgi:hypothetical protein
MSFKAKDEMHLRPFESLMDDGIKLSLKLATIAFNIKSQLFRVLDSFNSSILRTYEEKKTHNMLFFMLEPRFKNLHFVSSYVGKKQGMSIVE